MKSEIEEFCKSAFERFLRNYSRAVEIDWEEDEAPDYYLYLGGSKFAVEVRRIVEEEAQIGFERSPLVTTTASFERLKEEVKQIASDKGFLNGLYAVAYSGPFDNFKSIKKTLKHNLLEYIRTTRVLRDAPENLIFQQNDQWCRIRKLHNRSNGIGTVRKPIVKRKNEISIELTQLLQEILREKSYKLRKIEHPKILLLYDAYPLSSPDIYKSCVSNLISLEGFHTIFLVQSRGDGSVLYSRNETWKVSSNKISTNILLLGLVSFLADTSTHMMKPILPMFIAALGGGGLAVGAIGGLTESVASLLKVFSGYWSDRIEKRKPFVFLGYLTSAVVKLFFPLATIWQHILVLMPAERVGKGLREAPRDVLIAASARQRARGRGFGIHRAMDTSGAILGSLLAFILIWTLTMSMRSILLIAALVAFSTALPLFAVKEQAGTVAETKTPRPGLKGLPRPFYRFLAVATIFNLGNFTYMFLILRARQFFAPKLASAAPVLLYVLINVTYAAFSVPSGILSDKIGRKRVLLLGYTLFTLTCLGLASIRSWAGLLVLFGLYGVFRALTDGTQRALVADLTPPKVRGTALGAFHTATGLAVLPASIAAGAFWRLSPHWTFIYGAGLGLAAVVLLSLLCRSKDAIEADPGINSIGTA